MPLARKIGPRAFNQVIVSNMPFSKRGVHAVGGSVPLRVGCHAFSMKVGVSSWSSRLVKLSSFGAQASSVRGRAAWAVRKHVRVRGRESGYVPQSYGVVST